MDELFEELRKYYFISSDPRENGIHPQCVKIWDQMTETLMKMDKDELIDYFEALPEEDLEIIYPVVEDLVEEGKDYVEKYIRYEAP